MHQSVRTLKLIVLEVAAFCLTVCSFTTGTVCTAELRTSLSVTVTDAQTGVRLDSGSTVVVVGSRIHDSIVVSAPVPPSFPTALWFENEVPAGTYSVAVHRAGYVDWSRSGVVIKADECHVTSPANLTAALQRLGS